MGGSRPSGAKAVARNASPPGSRREAADRPGGRVATVFSPRAGTRPSMKPAGRVVSVFGVIPSRIGGSEVFARALSARLAAQGWESVLCYESLPEGEVRRFLELSSTARADSPRAKPARN